MKFRFVACVLFSVSMAFAGQKPLMEVHKIGGTVVHYDCPHPWQVRFGNDSYCYWNSYEWYPEAWDVITDFLSRKSEADRRVEHQIAHWGVSYKFENGGDGDCGFGSWLVTYRNTEHIDVQPAHRYRRIFTAFGDCGDRSTMGRVELSDTKEDSENPEWKGVK